MILIAKPNHLIRAALIGALCASAVAASAQSRLAVTNKGKPAGFATISQHLQSDAVKVVELRMEIASGGSKVKITSEARYDRAGMPLRKFQQAIIAGGALNKQVIVTFSADGAHVTLLDGGKRTLKTIPAPQGASLANLSEFWFVRDKPKPGQVEESYQFNTDSLEWERVRTEYRGKKTLKLEGRTVAVHEVLTSRGAKQSTAYVDEVGLPLLVDLGDVKMVKIWEK